jgi:hypothetical protein
MDHLVALADHRHDREEHDRLGAGRDDHFFGRDGDAARLADVLGDGLAELRQPCRRTVVRRPRIERLLRRLLDVSGRVEVGLPDFQVDDLAAGALELPRPGQHLEGGLRSQPGHPRSDVHEALLYGLALQGPYYKAWSSRAFPKARLAWAGPMAIRASDRATWSGSTPS